MKLANWCAAEQIRVAHFMRWWFEQNDLNPEDFPLDMDSGEWDEQYFIWVGPDVDEDKR